MDPAPGSGGAGRTGRGGGRDDTHALGGDFSSSPPMYPGPGGGAGRTGSGGGRDDTYALGGASSSSPLMYPAPSGGAQDNPYALGAGAASAAASARLVASAVEENLLVAVGGGGRAGGLPPPQGHFLDACYLCRKPLASNRDIFMYRGDIPFCTEECRREQIEMDEEMERKEATTKKVAQRPPSPKDVESTPKPAKTRTGSILAG